MGIEPTIEGSQPSALPLGYGHGPRLENRTYVGRSSGDCTAIVLHVGGWFRWGESNTRRRVQSPPACHWPTPDRCAPPRNRTGPSAASARRSSHESLRGICGTGMSRHLSSCSVVKERCHTYSGFLGNRTPTVRVNAGCELAISWQRNSHQPLQSNGSSSLLISRNSADPLLMVGGVGIEPDRAIKARRLRRPSSP